MTPEDIVRQVEVDMKEGSFQYQPAYWQNKLLLRIKALVENERAKVVKEQAKREDPVHRDDSLMRHRDST